MASYPIPDWIKPPGNLAQDYLSGLQTGAQIANQHAQLQQTAQLEQLKNTLAQQQLQRESQIQMQRLEVEKSYRDQANSIAQQKLAEVQQINQLNIQDASRKLALQQRYSQRVAAGEDASKVMLELGPELGAGEQSIAAAFRSQQANKVPVPPTVTKLAGEDFLLEPGQRPQQIRHAAPPKPTVPRMGEYQKAAMTEDFAVLKALENQIAQTEVSMPKKKLEAIKQRAAEMRQSLAEKYGGQVREVIRLDKSGRRVVYDANTRKPLRYADQQPADVGGDIGDTGDTGEESD
jgi:hypothetical protein